MGSLSSHVHVRPLVMQDRACGERKRARPGQGRQLEAESSHSSSEQNSKGSEV